jgi:hypothetical protein
MTGCNRFTDSKLIGIWRCEDEDGVEEITLNQDHSFQSLETFRKELVTPSVIEETGTWRLEGDNLKIDSVVTWSKERRHINRKLVNVTSDLLTIKTADGRKNLRYQRVKVPECTESHVKRSLNETDLFGKWLIHYHTHDYQYSFKKAGRVTLSATISDQTQQLWEGNWRVDGNNVVIQPTKDPYGNPANDVQHSWRIDSAGADCIVVNDGSSASYVMRRIK